MKEPVQHAERGLLARLFIENYPLKLLSLGFAIALFSLVHSDQDAQRSMYVDVVALLPPQASGKILVSPLPARVKVTLRGSRARLAALGHDDFTPVQMDLRDAGRQHHYFDTSAVSVTGPFRVVAIEPASVQLTWRVRADKVLPVEAKLTGTPAAGYTVRKPVGITPAHVTVSGPKEELELLGALATEDINVEGLEAGVHERRVRLMTLPGHVSFAAEGTVSVRVEIDARMTERTFAGLEVAVIGPGDVVLRPPTAQVTLRGPAPLLAQLTQDQVVPFVEPGSNAASGSVESLEVKLRGLPEPCTLVRVVPSSVVVRHTR